MVPIPTELRLSARSPKDSTQDIGPLVLTPLFEGASHYDTNLVIPTTGE